MKYSISTCEHDDCNLARRQEEARERKEQTKYTTFKHDHADDLSTTTDATSEDDMFTASDVGSEEDASSTCSNATANLLELARGRIQQQELHDEIDHLKEIITKKNEEIDRISGQLRRAVATKSALAASHSELEQRLCHSLKRTEQDSRKLQKTNLCLLEARAEIEKEYMNVIDAISGEKNSVVEKHREDLKEIENKHSVEMQEKDFRIAQLEDEIRRMRCSTEMTNAVGAGMTRVVLKD